MSDEYEEKMLEHYKNIAICLIEASPEHLDRVEMELEEEGDNVAIILNVSENPEDNFSPTDELLFAVDSLGDFMRSYDKMFSSATFTVFLKQDGKWAYKSHFEYST